MNSVGDIGKALERYLRKVKSELSVRQYEMLTFFVDELLINETRHCQNKTEALYQMRQPWVWCDGCAQIHFHTEWQNQLHHGVEDKNYD